MFKFPIFKKMGSSIDQIDIQDIREGIVKINKYKYFRVIQTSSINFQLKNEVVKFLTEKEIEFGSFENPEQIDNINDNL